MSDLINPKTDLSRRALLFGASQKRESVSVTASCLAFQGVACRACEDNCPERAIRFRPQLGGREHPLVDADACTACGECLPICPVSALTLSRGEANA